MSMKSANNRPVMSIVASAALVSIYAIAPAPAQAQQQCLQRLAAYCNTHYAMDGYANARECYEDSSYTCEQPNPPGSLNCDAYGNLCYVDW
jgi:hypothetical protein